MQFNLPIHSWNLILTATRIEVFVGSARSGRTPVLPNAAFKRLGYISFSTNHQNGYRSRELKSIPLDVSCQFVKLIVFENHVNYLNVFNQVGLVAVNVIGETASGSREGNVPEGELPKGEVPEESESLNFNRGMPAVVRSILPGYHNNIPAGGHVPPLEDLTFAVYQDKETARVIQHLQLRKEEAVRKEQFDQAKVLKQAIVDLRKVGEVLGHFEVEKKQAVDREDYELAKTKKLQSDNLRRHVYQQLNVFGLVQDPSLLGQHWHALKPIDNSTPQTTVATSRDNQVKPVISSPHNNPLENPQGIPLVGERVGQLTPLSPEVTHQDSDVPAPPPAPPPVTTPITAVEKYEDDRPLPALMNKSRQEPEEMMSSMTPSNNSEQLEPLSEKVANSSTLAIEVFGMELVQSVYAKQFKYRERAIGTIMDAVKSCDSHVTSRQDVVHLLKASTEMLKKLLTDKVASVFSESCALLKFLLTSFLKKCSSHLSSSDIGGVLGKVAPVLVGRLGDNMPRLVELTSQTLCELVQRSTLQNCQPLCDPILEPFGKQQSKWKLVHGRLNAILEIVTATGIDVLSSDRILDLAVPCFTHSNGGVRDVALELVVALYKLAPQGVRGCVPTDPPTRKKLIWRTLVERMDQIDGKPSRKQLQSSKELVDQAKMEEIAEMQKEVAQLRELAVTTGKIPQESSPRKPGSEKKQQSLPPSHNSLKKETQFKGSLSSTKAIISRVNLEAVDSGTTDKMCIFCEAHDDSFTEATLNQHYIQDCPMLYQCPHCSQVVEIPVLHQHYLTECDAKGKFKKCPRCKEAILVSQYHGHITSKSCKVPGNGSARCPLCGVTINSSEESWKKHVLEGKGCKKNPRPLQT
jgi:centrosomal protein CEP104